MLTAAAVVPMIVVEVGKEIGKLVKDCPRANGGLSVLFMLFRFVCLLLCLLLRLWCFRFLLFLLLLL